MSNVANVSTGAITRTHRRAFKRHGSVMGWERNTPPVTIATTQSRSLSTLGNDTVVTN
jgi:hypothetical protein